MKNLPLRFSRISILIASALTFMVSSCTDTGISGTPNIILIYIDDLGYGDLSCYGATRIATPEIDRLAENGIRFTRGYAVASTCTPSRYSMLTGEYAFRKKNTQIASGDASLIIEPGRTTLASVLKDAGYATAVVGKWHLGLGDDSGPDWNGLLSPGPQDLGFDYHFLIPATGDRVPCVYVENGHVEGLDPDDPIRVSFKGPLNDDPTGMSHPELIRYDPNAGHRGIIINGISRIGWMSGGHAARWRDEDMADTIVSRALAFMEKHREEPFFLYFSTHDIHEPRVPHERFLGRSRMGVRGDAILQLDWCVGQLMKKLESLGLRDQSLVIFTSDNGPVVDDGYGDGSLEKIGNHKPAGPYRGMKYSAFEGGTCVPFIVQWPAKINPGTSHALVSQVDLLSSLAALTGQELPPEASPDGYNQLETLLGKDREGRAYVIEQRSNKALSLVKGNWKYIEPSRGPFNLSHWVDKMGYSKEGELGNTMEPQLYNLEVDIAEQDNLAEENPEILEELSALLDKIKAGEPSLPE